MNTMRTTGTLTRVGSIARGYEVLLFVSLLWFVALFLRLSFPPLFETIQGVHGVSNTQTGLLFTLLLLGYSVVQFPAGWLSDRYGEPSIITFGGIVFTAGAVLATAGRSYSTLVLAAVLVGVGTGPHKTVSIPLLRRTYPERTGLSLGVMDTVGQFGGAVAPLVVAAVLASVFPWQTTFAVGTVVSAVLVLVYAVRFGTRPCDGPTGGGDGRNGDPPSASVRPENGRTWTESARRYGSILADRRFLAFVLVAVAVTFVWNGLSAFFPLYLATEKTISVEAASLLYGLLFAMGVSQTLTGVLSDRLGQVRISLLLFVLMAATIPLLVVGTSLLVLLPVTVVMGLGFHGFRPVRDSYLVESVPEATSGGVLGIVRTLMAVGGSLAPVAVGYLSEVTDFATTFALLTAILLVGGGVVAHLLVTRRLA